MKYKNIIFFVILLINALSSYAMSPSEYEYDGNGCTRCFGRAINRITYLASYYTEKHDADNRVYFAAYNYNPQQLASALKDGGHIDSGDLVGLATYAPAKNLVLLLEHGANPNVKDTKGNTAVELAIHSGHAPALAVLIQYGARLDTIGTTSKLTPDKLAKLLGSTHCLEVIHDAPKLRQAKLNEQLEAKKAVLIKQSWQKFLKDYRASSQSTSSTQAPAQASSSIDPEKEPQHQANELRKKQALEDEQRKKKELENEHERVAAKQKEAYQMEYTQGKRLARKKHAQLKQAKNKH